MMEGLITKEGSDTVRGFLESFERCVREDLSNIDCRLEQLRTSLNIDVFALEEAMLERVLDLRRSVVEVSQMRPFDEAILGGVTVRAEQLAETEGSSRFFCTLDADLLPWNRKREPRPELESLYGSAGFVADDGSLTVREDFEVP